MDTKNINRIASISTSQTIKIWTFDNNKIKLQKQLNERKKDLFFAIYTLECFIYFMPNTNF